MKFIKKLIMVFGLSAMVSFTIPNLVFATQTNLPNINVPNIPTPSIPDSGTLTAAANGVSALKIADLDYVQKQSNGTSVVIQSVYPGVTYDAQTNTVTLSGANIASLTSAISYVGDTPLTIVLTGSNSISATAYGIVATPASSISSSTQLLHITGSGTLNMTMQGSNDDPATAISSYGVSIESASVIISQNASYLFYTGIANQNSPLSLNDGHVSITYSSANKNMYGISSLNANVSMTNQSTLDINMVTPGSSYHTYGIFTQHTNGNATSTIEMNQSTLQVNKCDYGIFSDDGFSPSGSMYYYQGDSQYEQNYFLKDELLHTTTNPYQTAGSTLTYTSQQSLQISGSPLYSYESNEITSTDGIYATTNSQNNESLGITYHTTGPKKNLMFRFIAYNSSEANPTWKEISSWKRSEWFDWNPSQDGNYIVIGEIRDNLGRTYQTKACGFQISTKVQNTCATWEDANTILFGTSINHMLSGSYVVMELYNIDRQGWEYGSGKLPTYQDNQFYGNWWRLKNPEKGNYWGYFRVYASDGTLLDSQNYWLTVDH